LKKLRELTRIVLNILIPLGSIGLTAWLLPKLLRFFSPFVVGGIIALIANPLVRFLERKVKMGRKYGTALTIGGVLALVIVGGGLLLMRLGRELFSFLTDLPAVLENVGDQLQLVFARLEELAGRLPLYKTSFDLTDTMEKLGDGLIEMVKDFVAGLGAPTVEAAGHIAKGIPTMFVMVFITILSAYFFLAEKEKAAGFYRRVMPGRIQEYLDLMRRNIKRLVGGYFLAQFKIMIVVALLLVAGFLILRVPYAAIWAALIAFLDFLPVFGTGTVLIPWAVIEIVNNRFYMAAGLIACWLITQAVRQMIQPKVVGDSMGLNPLLTLFFLYLGFRFRGIGGMILAVPVGMIVIEFYEYGAFDPLIRAVRELTEFINTFRMEKTGEACVPSSETKNKEEEEK
jgi:sporulation integral membrane protein YtvI